jgi:ABC-2 type transport system permease protein
MLVSSAVSVLVFNLLFRSVSAVAGWSFGEVLFIFGFYSLAISPLQIFFDNIWSLRFHVIEGTFIKYYVRPINVMFYYMSDMLDMKGFIQLIVGIATLIYASSHLDIHWTFGLILLLILNLFASSLVVISILIIAASSAFWILDSYPALQLAFKLREFSQYPITIFDGFFRFLFTYIIPTGFVAYYPATLFLRRGNPSIIGYLSPLVGILLFVLAYVVWNKGVNQYTGTGS